MGKNEQQRKKGGGGGGKKRGGGGGGRGHVISRTHSMKEVALFSHLPQYERETSLSRGVVFDPNAEKFIHPAILKLGLKFGEDAISGADARCVGMLEAFKEVIRDYKTPNDKVLARDFHHKLNPLVQFLVDCKPLTHTMSTAVRFLKNAVSKIPLDMPEEEAKASLIESIDDYLRRFISVAQGEIIKRAIPKIVDGDVVLTYSYSKLLRDLFIAAHESGTKFTVVIVAPRSGTQVQHLLNTLTASGIECVFVLLTAVSYVMRRVSKVFLGASALMSNGGVLGPAGTALVATVARTYNKPVLVCAETYKFNEKVQLDALTYNELGDPDDLIVSKRAGEEKDPLYDWRDSPRLKLLNLVYDLTPSEHVTAVVTELG